MGLVCRRRHSAATIGAALLVAALLDTPAWAEPITGISAERIRSLAMQYATATPAMIVLGGSSMFKHSSGWEASRAIACLYAANPAAALIGSPLAGWLLGVHWLSLPGWRWLFILEGIPAIACGIVYSVGKLIYFLWN